MCRNNRSYPNGVVQIGRIPAACIAALLLIGCCGWSKSSDGLAAANLAALEQTVDIESPTVETDDALRFERTTLSLGEVRLGETRRISLTAVNISAEPLVVLDVTTACGCTKVDWSRKPIEPHGKTELRIAFTAEQEGVFFKKIAVRHSAAPRPVSFVIEGDVVR